MLFEEGALEQNLAARAATITIAAPECERFDDFIFAKSDLYETAKFTLRLLGAKLCVFDGAETLLREAILE